MISKCQKATLKSKTCINSLQGPLTSNFCTSLASFVRSTHRLIAYFLIVLIPAMFGLPELDYVVCLQLARHDLAQCARVNRMWHTAVIPYFWGDLTKCTDSQQRAFAKLVREDYYNEYGRRELSGESHDPQEPTQAQPALLLSAFGKVRSFDSSLGRSRYVSSAFKGTRKGVYQTRVTAPCPQTLPCRSIIVLSFEV